MEQLRAARHSQALWMPVKRPTDRVIDGRPCDSWNQFSNLQSVHIVTGSTMVGSGR